LLELDSSEDDVKKGIEYLHTLKVYPLASAASPPTIKFIDAVNSTRIVLFGKTTTRRCAISTIRHFLGATQTFRR
jgi:hypothetical protein